MMTENTRMIMEIGFNSMYLVTIWLLVTLMLGRLSDNKQRDNHLLTLFTAAFLFLAVGDTGHVGLRIVGYLRSDINSSTRIGGMEIGLVGVGALATAVTVSIFYIIMLYIWREYSGKRFTVWHFVLMAIMGFRFAVMLFPQNQWNSSVPPLGWSVLRNIPLTIFGLSVAFLFIRDALHKKDKVFLWIGICIVISYGFYIPVILLVQRVPVIGMLMIPKTIAYVAIAVIGYKALFQQNLKHQFMEV
jgi:hypothetical protein